MKIIHIVAASKNWVIGTNGELPWRIKSDLQFFKKTTFGHCLLMGRKTYESIGRPLPGRFSIIVSRSVEPSFDPSGGVCWVNSLDAAFESARSLSPEWPETVYVIGGGELYRQTMAMTSQVLLTRIDASVEGDTAYPNPLSHGFRVDEKGEWQMEGSWRFRMERWKSISSR